MKQSKEFQESCGIEKKFSACITLIALQIYSDECNSSKMALVPREHDDVCVTIQNMLQAEIECTLKEQVPLGLEVLDLTLRLSENMSARILQSLKLNLGRLLDGILLTIEKSANPACSKQQRVEDQVLTFKKLKFLGKWVEIYTFDKIVVLPSASLINLVNMLLKPLRCGDKITLAIAELIFHISKSAKREWTLNCKQLRIISSAIIEIMGSEDEKCRVEAAVLTAKFVIEYSSKFDYSTSYPVDIFWNLREFLSDLIWKHLFTPNKNVEKLFEDSANNVEKFSQASNIRSVISLAEAMRSLFIQLKEIQRKCIQASPLTLNLVIDLKAQACKNDETIQKLIETLLTH